MNLSNNTMLITGGSSGIGLDLCRKLIALGNDVITCGRSAEKLAQAKTELPTLHTYVCDLADPQQCDELIQQISTHHPHLNVLINNAALVHRSHFLDEPDALNQLTTEINANLLAPIRLLKGLYPIMAAHPQPTCINITTGLVYTPRATYPFYNATKAALHSFTQVLRLQTPAERLRVMEVLFPVVDTPWHQGKPPKMAIPVAQAVDEMLRGLQKGKPEIRVGKVKLLYRLSRLAPGFALKVMNRVE